jgi:hypothetical protein
MVAGLDRRKAYELAQAREREMRKKGEIDALEDVARSGLTGVGEGVAGVVGLPMAAIDMVTRGGDWLGRKARIIADTPEHRAWLDGQLRAVDDYLPTSEETLHAMNDYTKGLGLNSERTSEPVAWSEERSATALGCYLVTHRNPLHGEH